MIELTVGYVAGVIALAIFTARVYAPSILTFILSAILRDKNSAATWTVAAAALQRSYWPNILQSDGAKNHGVRKDIVVLTYLITLISALIAVAGIVTPLGLYETLVATNNIQTPFKYLKDASPFGYGTPPRSNLAFNRACGDRMLLPCPFTDTIAIGEASSSGNVTLNFPYGYDTNIPDVIKNTYSSGIGNDTTISNYFDIQWRRYQLTSDSDYNNGSAYMVGAYRLVQSMILADVIQPVEGLIVDTIGGAIGFRNHTVPPGFKYGATWEEDILFVEPETVCVDTNTTIDYTIASSPNSSVSIVDLILTDRGGFVDINTTYPRIDLTDTQAHPNLYLRAYKAAWMTNAWTMLLYNITNQHNETSGQGAFSYLNSTIGKKFAVPNRGQSKYYDSLGLDTTFREHLNIGGGVPEGASPSADASPPLFVDGFTSTNFSDIHLICTGAGRDDYANITNIFVNCGLMRGVPQRIDPGPSMIFESGSRWSQKLYGCASAVKATVKTVSFTFNGTEELQSLKITLTKKKEYADVKSMPLWGVENTGNRYSMADMSSIWGIVSSEYENNRNVSTVQQESLYLPGYSSERNIITPLDHQNLPASDFFPNAMGQAYLVGGDASSPFDYSGDSNMAMWARWQNLTSSPDTAALIPNLIFTDYAAAAVVGTKGVLGPGNAAQRNLVALPVTPTERRIRYRWPFAVPALIVALCLVLMTLAAFVTLIFGHGNLAKLRLHLQQTSTGRIFTIFLYPEQGGMHVRTKDWSKRIGAVLVDLSGDYPMGAAPMSLPEKYERSASGEALAEGQQFLGGNGHARNLSEDIGAQGFAQPQPYTSVQHSVPPSGRVGAY